jgi:two-component sensor histidine kinase
MDSAWEGAALEEIVRLELDAFSDRTIVNGPSIVLNPGMAQTFALLLHELATNATKYGALSVKAGKVSARWSIEGKGKDARFRFRWQERNGPAVVAPTSTGFGSTLLERVIAVGPDRKANIVFAPKGLIYRLELPLQDVSMTTGRNRGELAAAASDAR